jgi:endonuclease YncB( thermonuclease family)
VDDAERIAMVHHLLIAAEEEAIAAKAPLSVNVSNALDLLVSDSPVTPGYIYRATGTRVVDGDTFIAAVDLGFRVTYSCIVRLHGINAPEKNKTGGQSAKAALEQLVLNRRLLQGRAFLRAVGLRRLERGGGRLGQRRGRADRRRQGRRLREG